MNESIHKYMKVGIIHFMAYPSTMKGEGPIVETVKKKPRTIILTRLSYLLRTIRAEK